MVSLAAQNRLEATHQAGRFPNENQSFGDSAPANSVQAIKINTQLDRSQRVDDAIELEQDAARLARNTIGMSHQIANQQLGLSRQPNATAVQKAQAQALRTIHKSPIQDSRLTQFQNHQSPQEPARARKRSLLGEPAQRVTMHRPTGAQTMPASVVVC
jgi:hypothetical protein